jgi:heme exporter protein D
MMAEFMFFLWGIVFLSGWVFALKTRRSVLERERQKRAEDQEIQRLAQITRDYFGR